MSDIAVNWVPANGSGDWSMAGALLQSGNELITAVLISLFTDRQAGPNDIIPDGTEDPRGWWADDPRNPIGSRLWLLSRAKQTTDTLNRAMSYTTEALKWLIDDGVVAKFDITVEWTRSSQLGVQVIAYRKDGTNMAMNFQSVWKGLN